MSDFGRAAQGGDEDRLPWLEAVEDEQADGGPGAGRLVLAVLVALGIIGLVVGGIFWLRDRPGPGAAGEGELIAAPAGAYKTKPGDPGGMQVEGAGDVTYPASEGADPNAAIDLAKLPEAPVTDRKPVTAADATVARPAASGKPAATATAAVRPAAPKPTAAAPAATAEAAPAPAGGLIQLGAFGSEAKANAAWKTLSKRFAFLAPFTPVVQPVAAGEKTLYRLRVPAGAQAGAVCGKLTVAGETCARVG